METIKKEETFIKNHLIDSNKISNPQRFIHDLSEIIQDYIANESEGRILNSENFLTVFLAKLHTSNEKEAKGVTDNVIEYVAKNSLFDFEILFEEFEKIIQINSNESNPTNSAAVDFIALYILYNLTPQNAVYIQSKNFPALINKIFEIVFKSDFDSNFKFHYVRLLNTLYLYKILDMDEIVKLKTLIDDLCSKSKQKFEMKEKEMNSVLKFDSEKISQGLKERKILIGKEKKNGIESFLEVKSQTMEKYNSELRLNEIIQKIKKLFERMENLEENEILPLIESHSDLILFLSMVDSEFDEKMKKKFQKFISYFTSKKVYAYARIKEIFFDKIREDFFSVEDKNLTINLNNLIQENVLDRKEFIYFKHITEKFPIFLIENLQSLFDNFISYFSNPNYFLQKQTRGEKNTYKLEIKENLQKIDLLENFAIFIEIISNIFYFLKIIKKISQSFYQDETINRNEYMINYEVSFGSASKKTNGSVILALSYTIQLFFNNFRKNLLENFENIKSEISEDSLTPDEAFSKYKEICNLIAQNFDEVKNFKFYDLNENFSSIKCDNSNFGEIFFRLRDMLNNSVYDANNSKVIRLSFTDFIEKVYGKAIEIDVKEEINKNIQSLQSFSSQFEKLKNEIMITENFTEFLQEFFQVLRKSKDVSNGNLSRYFSLIHLIYNTHLKIKEFTISDFSDILILHNNIEAFLLFLNYSFLFDSEIISIYIAKDDFFKEILIFFKSFSSSLINQIISFFISELINTLSKIESLEDIRFERNSKLIQKIIKHSIELIQNFFTNFVEFSDEKVFMFNLNYILSLYFDFLNRKILNVKDFNLDDVKVLISLSKNISNDLKRGIENIFDKVDRMSEHLKLEFTNVLENNLKYKKFEEILFVLNANMKEIRNFLIHSNFSIHIDPIELVELIKSIFEDNLNRKNLIEYVNEKLYPK